MTNKTTWLLVAAVSLLLFHSLQAQQTAGSRMTLDQRLEEIEARLDAMEKRLAEPPAAEPLGNSAAAKLDRLEVRVIRLEESPSQRLASGAPDRRTEARIRSLERQVARLRQP